MKSSKGYEYFARKHNLRVMSKSIIAMRDRGIDNVDKLDDVIKIEALKIQNLQDKIKIIEKEMKLLHNTMENLNILSTCKEHYNYYVKNKNDNMFKNEYKSEINKYKLALKELKKHYKTLPKSKDILSKLSKLKEKKNTLMKEYSSTKSDMTELYKIRKNYEDYIKKIEKDRYLK